MSEHIEFGTTGKPHPYHMVRPSIWPLCGAAAGGMLAGGMVMYMHEVTGLWSILPGLLCVLAVMFFWWKDIGPALRHGAVYRVRSHVLRRILLGLL
jgi:hypothetical protein